MIDSAARVPEWPRTVDAGRCPRDWHSGGATGRFSGYRSGAAGRAQAGAWVVESVIYPDGGRLDVAQRVDPGVCERKQVVEMGARERGALGGGLDLDEAAVAGHHDVGIDLGRRVLGIVEV